MALYDEVDLYSTVLELRRVLTYGIPWGCQALDGSALHPFSCSSVTSRRSAPCLVFFVFMSTLGDAHGYPMAQRGAAAASEETRDERCLDIDLCWVCGDSLGSVHIESETLGRELVAKVRDLLWQPRGIVTLAFEATVVNEGLPVGQHGLQGPMLAAMFLSCQSQSSKREMRWSQNFRGLKRY